MPGEKKQKPDSIPDAIKGQPLGYNPFRWYNTASDRFVQWFVVFCILAILFAIFFLPTILANQFHLPK